MTTEEHVDIVNEQNEVIGTTTKTQAHIDGLLHRTVIAEVVSPDGKWTLVKQASDRQDPGQYVSPVGGHVQSGESVEDALKREAFEEYGLTGDFEYRYIGKKIYNREVNGKKENHYFIVYEITTDKEPVLNEESVNTSQFTSDDLAKQLKSNPDKFGGAFHFVVQSFFPELLE